MSTAVGVVTAGEELVAKLRAEMDVKDLEPDSREEGLCFRSGTSPTRSPSCARRIDAEGLTFPPASPGGPPRLHPAVAEIRRCRSLLGRLLARFAWRSR